MIMKTIKINNSSIFAISYEFFDESRETEIQMLIRDDNILSFKRDEQWKTTRWNLDNLLLWLRKFVDSMEEDSYPVNVDGDYAAIKDINAREFDSDDDDEFDLYYDRLDEWNSRHRWHTFSDGAILADLYFQLVGNDVEISWNNLDSESDIYFKYRLGGAKIPKEEFILTINTFLNAYAEHWFDN